jgi:RimJ/RimL family protein N-acetyltransferase
MKKPEPITLSMVGVRLEPLTADHVAGLEAAACDGELWTLRVTSVPAPGETADYVSAALNGQAEGHMLPFAVRDAASGAIIGSTRYHDVVPAVERLEIGYTWYGRQWQRSHVNTTCKLLLLAHAFEALDRALRRDGTVRDTVMYSLAAGEWPEVKAHLTHQLTRAPAGPGRLTC